MDESWWFIERLQKIVAKAQESPQEKEWILEQAIKEQRGGIPSLSFALPDTLRKIWLSLFVIHQDHLTEMLDQEALISFLEQLLPVEEFYASLGGVVGYHLQMLSLLFAKEAAIDPACSYSPPQGIDISIQSEENERYLQAGIDSLPYLGEIYVVGGAADRLRPYDPITQDSLAAALFSFCGHTLLEWLIRDLEARELLYREKWGKEIITPIAMMTSPEKNNHEQILSFCEKKEWFGRGKSNIRFFEQPLVPTMDSTGKWCGDSSGKLLMKPGGHGVLWKLALDKGIFSWMKQQNRTKVLVRQINNPIAGIDRGLLTFCGIGFARDKQFGFASCLRRVASAEGVNVLIQRNENGAVKKCLTNIEYCDFSKCAIQDIPLNPGGSYSRFPSNTNILLADIHAVEQKIREYPIPGMLVNRKKVSFKTPYGDEEREVVRLESTMQNLADAFESSATDFREHPTFLTYHERHKTISAIKKRLTQNAPLLETPEGCLYDWLRNMHELLSLHCHMSVPSLGSEQNYLDHGPSFLFFYHPALGPLFSKIAEKIQGGELERGSEVRLEMSDVLLENLQVSGSLQIEANPPIPMRCAMENPRLVLKDVEVKNQGSDYGENEGVCQEKCKILIEGDGEFYAEGITFLGNHQIIVKAGTRVTALEIEGRIELKETLTVVTL